MESYHQSAKITWRSFGIRLMSPNYKVITEKQAQDYQNHYPVKAEASNPFVNKIITVGLLPSRQCVNGL